MPVTVQPALKNSPTSAILVTTLVLCVLLAVQAGLSGQLKNTFQASQMGRTEASTGEETSSRWDPSVFRMLSFGNLPAALDWIWIQVLLDERINHVPKGTHPKIYYDLSLLATLDPAFFDVYHAGAHLLAVIRDDGPGAYELLEKGNVFRKVGLPKAPKRLKDQYWSHEWSLPLLQAYVALFELGDLSKASQSFIEAAAIPGSPPYLEKLRDRLQRPGGQYEVGLRLLNFMILGADKEESREALTKKRASLVVAQYVYDLNHAFEEFLRGQSDYRVSHSIPPEKMQKYWRAFLKAGRYPERDPWGGRVSMDNRGRVKTTTHFDPIFGLDGET